MNQALHYLGQNISRVSTGVSPMDDPFATEQLMTMRSAEWRADEEELHRLFDQAISDRVQATGVQFKQRRVSVPAKGGAGRFVCSTVAVPLKQRTDTEIWSLLFGPKLRRTLILASLALFLLLSGFDLMGLLVLHMR